MNAVLDITSAKSGSNHEIQPSRMRRHNTRLRKSWVLLPVFLAIAGTAVTLQQKREDPIAVSTERAKIRNLVHLVSATGKIRPEREVKISSEAAGEIIEMPVMLGQHVKTGDLLVNIKPDNYVALVRQAEASLAAAKAESLMREARMLNDDLDFCRLQELFSKRLISETEHAAAETRAKVSRASYEASLAQIEVAQSNLEQSKDLLNKCTIVSPIDGTIDSLTSEIGERVVATGSFAGTEMMRIANLRSMEAWVDVNENDVVNVKLGDPVRVHVDAYPERTFAGVVKRIANTASVQNQGTQQEVTNFEVRIQILHPDLQIRPRMSASVEIETQIAHHVLSVPIQSVTVRDSDTGKTSEQIKDEQTNDQGSVSTTDLEKRERKRLERVVFIRQGGVVKLRGVQLGITDDDYIQILSGIKPGDEVVSSPYVAISKDLKDGSVVKIEAP